MGLYGRTIVKSTVLRADIYPHKLLMETEDFVAYDNGRALVFPEGIMVIVNHSNAEGWGPDYYHRTIWVVPTSNYYPDLNANEESSFIGYWENTPGELRTVSKHMVKRDSFVKGDEVIIDALKSEGRQWK